MFKHLPQGPERGFLIGVYMSTRGAQKGNQNAAKERRKSEQVVFRCFEEDRESWEARAKSEGFSLGAWICKELRRVRKQETP